MPPSSFIVTPSAPEMADSWSTPELFVTTDICALYTATHHGKKYVLKTLNETYRQSTPHIELLQKEYAIGLPLEHPHIVHTIDYGFREDIGYFIQLEYIDGITLDQFLSGKVNHKTRLRILYQLLDAVAYLHSHQIIHRDLKPSNILITHNGASVKLIDFGVADEDSYVALKHPAGSLSYIAPEQLAGDKLDCRADIYAIGCIIHDLFPHSFSCIAHKCKKSNREKRYASCQEIHTAIQKANRRKTWIPVLLGILLLTGFLTALYSNDDRTVTERSADTTNTTITTDTNHIASAPSIDEHTELVVHQPSTAFITPEEKAKQLANQDYQAIHQAIENGTVVYYEDIMPFYRTLPDMDSLYLKERDNYKDPIQLKQFSQAYQSYRKDFFTQHLIEIGKLPFRTQEGKTEYETDVAYWEINIGKSIQ